jgi:hypothetical protein
MLTRCFAIFLGLCFVGKVLAQTHYSRYVIGTDTYLWTEARDVCPTPCFLKAAPIAKGTDNSGNFQFEVSALPNQFSFALHFLPKYAGRFIDTVSLSWECAATRECNSSGPTTLRKVFYAEAIPDSGFYFSSNSLDLSLADDTIQRVVLDTFYLPFFNKSGGEVDIIKLRALSRDSSNFHLMILNGDSDAILRIASGTARGDLVGLFETTNGPDTAGRSCFMEIEYRESGQTKFDTIFVSYASKEGPQDLSINLSQVTFANPPGAYADTTVQLSWTRLVDSVWISDSALSPFQFVASTATGRSRRDTYAFRSIDSREVAASSIRYSYSSRLYSGERVTHDGVLLNLQWAARLDSLVPMGHLQATYFPHVDTVSSTPYTEIKIGSIAVSSACSIDPRFTVVRYNEGQYHLTHASDTSWDVWVKRLPGQSGYLRDSARIFMTLTGAGCPALDVAGVDFSVFMKQLATVAEDKRPVADISVAQSRNGDVVLSAKTDAWVTIHAVTGEKLYEVDLPAGKVINLSILKLPAGLYFFFARYSTGLATGKVVILQ